MQTKDKSIIISMMLFNFLMFVGSASASTCTDAGDFEGICTVLTDIANGIFSSCVNIIYGRTHL